MKVSLDHSSLLMWLEIPVRVMARNSWEGFPHAVVCVGNSSNVLVGGIE